MEKEEASLPTLKAAAGNPEGSFTLAATEAGPEVGGDAPVMTEAVGPLVTAVVRKMRPPAWTSLQFAGSTVRLLARKKSIPKMAVETSASKKFQVKFQDWPAVASLRTRPSTGWVTRLAQLGLVQLLGLKSDEAGC